MHDGELPLATSIFFFDTDNTCKENDNLTQF